MRLGNLPNALVLPVLTIAVLGAAFLSMSCGQIDIPTENILAVFCRSAGLPFLSEVPVTPEQETVLLHIRLPRTLVGLMVGAGLGTSGVVMQGIL